MYTRTVPSALRGLGRLNGPTAGTGHICMRSFSSTPNLSIRAVYSETDNAELNSILGEIQEKIILPAYLPQKQRGIVFDPAKRTYLEQNPIDIEVEGHEHRFKAIDKTKDIPKTREIFWKALASMKTNDDWNNLGTLLAGFRRAGIKLTLEQQAKLLRLATRAGQLGLIVECLKQAQRTDLYIANKEQLVYVYLAVCSKVDAANGDLTEIKQATRSAETILDLVQRPENVKRIAAGRRDTRSLLNFSILGRSMLLYARASLLKAKQEAGEAIDGELVSALDDIALLKTLWGPHLNDGVPVAGMTEIAELFPKDVAVENEGSTASETAKNAHRALSGSFYVQSLAWTIRAVRAANEVSPEEAAPLVPLVDSLAKHVGEVLEKSGSRREDWAKNYEDIVGEKASSS